MTILDIARKHSMFVIRHFLGTGADTEISVITPDEVLDLISTAPPEGQRAHRISMVLDKVAVDKYKQYAQKLSGKRRLTEAELDRLAEDLFFADLSELGIAPYGAKSLTSNRGWAYLVDQGLDEKAIADFDAFLDSVE